METTASSSPCSSSFYELVALGRFPGACFVSPAAAKVLADSKDAAGAFLFPPGQPMIVKIARGADTSFEIPIIPLYGLATGLNGRAYLGDIGADGVGLKIAMIQRSISNRLLLQVDRSDVGATFATDSTKFRLTLREDFGVVPGQESSFLGFRTTAP